LLQLLLLLMGLLLPLLLVVHAALPPVEVQP
jgi:hypothetical protein